MKCIICESEMNFYFSKSFHDFDLSEVDYWKCSCCGFCASKTHFDMAHDQWAELNKNFHSKSHYIEDNPYNRNERYFNQALMLYIMLKHSLVERGAWLDWGCGVGSVAILLKEFFDIDLMTYDKYFSPNINAINESELLTRSFDLVVNTGVFEHVRDRNTLNEIESYVGDTGCFAIHTLVTESVPKNPDWMYLLPVHCAFHTNKSMQILMDEWGYSCSVYNEISKMWVLFRKDANLIQSRVSKVNGLLGYNYLHFKQSFMDYWK